MKKIKLKLFDKMFRKNDDYDDLLEMTVADKKYQIWLLRILFFVVVAVMVIILF